MGEFIFGVVIMFVGAALFSLISGAFIKLAAKWITKTTMLYGHAYKTALVGSVANLVILMAFGFMTGFMGPAGGVINLLYFPVAFCVMAAVISSRLAIPYGMSCLVTLVSGALSGVVAMLLFGLFMLLAVVVGMSAM